MWHEKLFASVFALSREPIFVVERTSRTIIDCNAAAVSLFGWPRTDLIGKSTQILTGDAETWKNIPSDFAARMDAGEIAELKMHGRHRDGTVFPVLVRGRSFAHESAVYNVLYIADLTEIEQANEKLRREAFALAERIKELRCAYRVSDALSDTHSPLETRIGLLPAYLKAAWQFPDRTHARIELRGAAYSSPGYQAGVALQSAPIHANGNVYGSITVSYDAEMPSASEGPFLKEERALIEDVAKRIGDAVARNDADQERRRTGARLQFISEYLPLSILISDIHTGEILYVNARARHEFDIGDDEPLSQHNMANFCEDPEDRKKLRARFDADGKLTGQVARMRLQGATRWNSVYAERIEFEGRPAIYSVRIDVTEQRKAEEERRRSDARLHFIAQNLPLTIGIHDARTDEILYLNPKARREYGLSDDAPLTGLKVAAFLRTRRNARNCARSSKPTAS